jgi:lysophospholipase L1-like esterase
MKSSDSPSLSRRRLFQGALSMGTLSAMGGSLQAAETGSAKPMLTLKKGAVILFQGDSITDEGRKKDKLDANDTAGLGRGYPADAAGLIMADHPELELKFYNRGISGNKVPDLAARWKADCIDLKPDILSILIGVNDIWHTFAFGTNYQGTIANYEEGYRQLIKDTLAAKADTRIVICEPFTTRDNNFKSKTDGKTVADFAVVAKKIADDLKLTFVPFQAEIDKACKAAPANFWLWDGIHPSQPGHAMLAQAWRRAVGI